MRQIEMRQISIKQYGKNTILKNAEMTQIEMRQISIKQYGKNTILKNTEMTQKFTHPYQRT